MKNRIYFTGVILLLLNFLMSCSNEDNIDNNIYLETEFNENIVTELPENVISLDQLIHDLNAKNESGKLSNKGLGGTKELIEDDLTFHKKFFVVYPTDWTSSNKFGFYQRARIELEGEIYVEPNDCEYVDTWYIPKTFSFKDKNSKKNLIVASNSGLKGGSGSNGSQEDDGPKDPTDYFNSCEQIQVSEYQNN